MNTFAEALGNVMLVIGVLLLYAALLGFPLMFLWNVLMPELFGLKTIGFWQAVGLNVLCSILFKGSSSSSSSK